MVWSKNQERKMTSFDEFCWKI